VLTPEQETQLGSTGSPFAESVVVVDRAPHLEVAIGTSRRRARQPRRPRFRR
jgi:hypothetical protein